MMFFRYMVLILFSLITSTASFASASKNNKINNLYSSEPAFINNISDRLLITLTNDDIITLPNIYIPDEVAKEAYKLTLTTLPKEQAIFIQINSKTDRYGHLKTDIKNNDNNELQTILLQNGLALFMPTISDNDATSILLKHEKTAQKNHVGIWSQSEPYIKTPENISHFIGEYQIVTGKVVSTYKSKKHVYLNFGADWTTDFTVSIPIKNQKYFHAKDMYPLNWKDHHIQIRGWVELYNGAMIKALTPSQITLIPAS